MEVLLLLAIAFLGWKHFWLRRQFRTTSETIEKMLATIQEGNRPRTFILHGPRTINRIGLALEGLAIEREQMARRISQEGFNSHAILSSMEEGVIIIDTSRMIQLVNTSFLKLFNLQTPPLGKSMLHVLRNAGFDEGVKAALASEEIQEREVHLPLTGQRLVMTASPLRNEKQGDRLLGLLILFRDVTHVRQLEEVRREFVANVSHELRTPLSIFQGYLEMLIDHPDLPRDDAQNALQVLRRHSNRLNLLVEDLLSLARLEGRRETFDLRPTCIPALLKSVRADWLLKASGQEVTLQVKVAQDLPPILTDSLRVTQIMNNLMENALNFTGAGGTISLEATLQERDGRRQVEIAVRDSGQGIPAADLPHIFERFYRADKARSRVRGGTGLGLSIVKHLVQAQNGTCRAESQTGQGTTIYLTFPAHTPSTATPAPTTSEES